MKRIMLELDDELAAQVDKRRGDVPRVRWIRSLIATELGGIPGPPPKSPEPIPSTAWVSKIPVDAPTVEELRAKIRWTEAATCLHPITRRIGTRCAVCGKENVK